MADTQARHALDERKDRILAEARDVFDDDAELWLRSPNEYLGGRSPHQAVDDGDWEQVRELLQRIKFVGIS